jgi:methylmalonyl-CoA/ethylmalonyl-CoA epimerase
MPLGLSGSVIDHVGVAVPDLDAAIRFYTETLGGTVVHQERNDEQGVVEAMVQFGDDPRAAQVQLLAPIGPTSSIARFIDTKGAGLQQLALRVADVEAAVTVLRARGLRVLYDTAKRGTGGSRINFVHPRDAGGVLIELVEYVSPLP